MATPNPTPQQTVNPTPQQTTNPTPTAQQRAAIAARQSKLAKQRIRDIWTARMSIQYAEARKVSHAEVDAALDTITWQKEYEIAGKNTHVNIPLHFHIYLF